MVGPINKTILKFKIKSNLITLFLFTSVLNRFWFVHYSSFERLKLPRTIYSLADPVTWFGRGDTTYMSWAGMARQNPSLQIYNWFEDQSPYQEASLLNYLPIGEGRIVRFIPFPSQFAQ